MEVLTNLIEIKKEKDKYLFTKKYKVLMSEDEYKNNIQTMKKQIKTADQIIKNNDFYKLSKKLAEELKQKLAEEKEALKNFDKNYEEEIKKEIENLKNQLSDEDRLRNKKIIEDSIKNHLKFKELKLKQLQEKIDDFLDPIKLQKQDDLKMLKLYEELGQIDGTKENQKTETAKKDS